MSGRLAAAAAVLVGGLLAVAAGAGAAPPQPAARCGPPEVRATTFTFRARDGVTLDGAVVGWGRRGIVLVHEAGGRALCGFWPYAVRLSRRGFHVLLFDLRCFGESACPARGQELVERDVRAAVDRLARAGCTSVELVGASFGGSAVLVAAAHDARVTAVADLSGDENDLPLAAHRPVTAAAAAPDVHRPALVALARDDGFVTAAAERRLYAALGTRSKRLVLLPPGVGHGWDLLERPGGGWSTFERTLTRFLAAHA